MANKGRAFTAEDRLMLRTLNADGYLVGEIARKMDRTPGVITKYMQMMGLTRNTAASRRLKRLDELKARAKRAAAAPKPMSQRFSAAPRPAAILGPDVLLARLQAGRR